MSESDAATLDQLLPLSPPVYHVLLALGRRTLHGYAIMQVFDELTDGREEILAGTLYATLARMVESGLVVEADAPDAGADRRRRYYRATERGRALAGAESDRLRRLVRIAEAQRLVSDAS